MLQPLVDTLVAFFDSRTHRSAVPMLDRACAELRAASAADVVGAQASPLPAVSLLPEVRVVPNDLEAAAVAAAFAAVAPRMVWTQTQAYLDSKPPEVADTYGYVKILGPDAPLPADDVAVTIGVWGAGLDFPMHHHSAEEAYYPLGGRPTFRSADGEWTAIEPGGVFHQPSWAPHEQRFGPEPCLLMWVWGGEVREPASLVEAS